MDCFTSNSIVPKLSSRAIEIVTILLMIFSISMIQIDCRDIEIKSIRKSFADCRNYSKIFRIVLKRIEWIENEKLCIIKAVINRPGSSHQSFDDEIHYEIDENGSIDIDDDDEYDDDMRGPCLIWLLLMTPFLTIIIVGAFCAHRMQSKRRDIEENLARSPINGVAVGDLLHRSDRINTVSVQLSPPPIYEKVIGELPPGYDTVQEINEHHASLFQSDSQAKLVEK
ncbi:hypothetical protein NH340_JMT02223 [Sarcoptes scabiei]|nr:hypothetical protein NH340_JMT02223 [Sarcoptes scabiei]